MRWLVDGMNVVGSKPDGWWRDREAAMRRLVGELDAYARETGDPVTVVFDGAPFEVPDSDARVLFASRRGPNAADDDIVALLEEDPDPASVVVVSSDAELARRARALGAEVVGARALRRRLAEAARER